MDADTRFQELVAKMQRDAQDQRPFDERYKDPEWGDWFDRQGQKISMERWGELFHDRAYKRVALSVIAEADGSRSTWVSTVWLGNNHAFFGGRPVIFETMTFPDSEVCDRYCTEEQALAGHKEYVTVVRATYQDPVIRDATDQEFDDADPNPMPDLSDIPKVPNPGQDPE